MALRKYDVDNMSADQFAAKMKDPDFVNEFNALYPPNSAIIVDTPAADVDPEGFVAPTVPAVAPTEEVAPIETAPVAEVEQRHEYQPVDKYGRKVGGLQVIKYKTQAELIEKLTKNHTEAIVWGREEHKARILGTPIDGDEIPADAERGEVEFVKLEPKVLSTEDRFKIIQEMQDPATFEEGRAKLFESEFGVPPSTIRDLLNTTQVTAKQAVAEAAFAEFQRETPDFYPDVDNITMLTTRMVKHGLLPTVKNFKLAYDACVKTGLLNAAPVVQQVASAVVAVEQEPKTVAPVVPDTRISAVAEPVQTPRIQAPSGLNDRTSSSSSGRPAVDDKSLKLADIENMSGDEYKRRMKDPAFAKHVDSLYQQAEQRRAQRQASRI